MNHKRPPIPVIVIVVLAILVGGYFGIRSLLPKNNTSLTASGTIEAIDVTISPEIGGKVAEVLVEEGASVKAGDELFRLDDALLRAQRAVAAAGLDSSRAAAKTAEAALASAQSQYDLTLDAARTESAASRVSNWKEATPSGFDQPNWYFSRNEQIDSAQGEVAAATGALQTAKDNLAGVESRIASADYLADEMRLVNARAAYLVAKDVLDRANASSSSDLKDAAQRAYDSANAELEAAQKAYKDVLSTQSAQDILTARAELADAQERDDTALGRLLALQTGEDSPKVTAAQSALSQAQAASDQAQQAVAQAEASLALIDTQIAKLTVRAPADGVIQTRSIEPGEVIAASATALTLGRLEDLTLTVYVPEDRYGEVSLVQAVNVTVDSFPGETFSAKVVHIADQAEYTPRNVQTVEGRKATVFAIKLQVNDPQGKLKPGMPADVTFEK